MYQSASNITIKTTPALKKIHREMVEMLHHMDPSTTRRTR